MKKILLLLSLITVITGCNFKSTNKTIIENDHIKFNKAYDKASKCSNIVDTIFLGLRFGMSSAQVNSHLEDMLKKGKLKINIFNKYEYTLIFENNGVKATLSAEYFKDKLYKFSLNFEEYGINDVYIPMDDQVMVNLAKRVFLTKIQINKEKYDSYYYTLDGLGTFANFIRGNLLVEFSPLGKMNYINIPVEKEKEIYDKKIKQKNTQSSISDL